MNIDIKMSTLKPLLYGWLFKAWAHVNKPEMIKIGRSQCGLLQAFDPAFQVQAMDENMKIPYLMQIQVYYKKRSLKKKMTLTHMRALKK